MIRISNIVILAFSLLCEMCGPCKSWELKTGNDQKSGRAFSIMQQWSHDEAALLGIECQNQFESGMIGIAVLNPELITQLSNVRQVDIRIGIEKPIKMEFSLERRSDLINYYLTNTTKRSRDNMIKLLTMMEKYSGDITIFLDGGNALIFKDDDRSKIFERWRSSCFKGG